MNFRSASGIHIFSFIPEIDGYALMSGPSAVRGPEYQFPCRTIADVQDQIERCESGWSKSRLTR
jgi:hypothetical protein